MVKERRIDSIFKRKRDDCETQETGGGEVTEGGQATPIQPSVLLLEFRQQTHEEQGHQTHTNEVVFRGIEFLERDPAVRPQIWQYPQNQRDEV